MMEQAAKLFVTQLETKSRTGKGVFIEPRLIVRDSTGPAPRKSAS
jgi:DNA-binding LacI/PurR family transcriptional regulator